MPAPYPREFRDDVVRALASLLVVALDGDAVRPAYLYELVPDAVPPSA